MPELRALMDRIKAAEREFHATTQAVSGWSRSVRNGENRLRPPASPRDLEAAIENLESTYLIRIWAEFETALRSYRRHVAGVADDRIGTGNLVDWTAGVKQGRSISEEVVEDVHEVRDYRNHLVHRRDGAPSAVIDVGVARRRLNVFLQKLPDRW